MKLKEKKEQFEHLTKNEKISTVCGICFILFLIIAFIFCIIFIKNNSTTSQSKEPIPRVIVKEAIETISDVPFENIVADIVAREEDYATNENNPHKYSLHHSYNIMTWEEPETNTYDFTIYYEYSDVDNLTVFNKIKEYHITKYDAAFEIYVKSYPVDINKEPIGDTFTEEIYQYTVINGELKYSNE